MTRLEAHRLATVFANRKPGEDLEAATLRIMKEGSNVLAGISSRKTYSAFGGQACKGNQNVGPP